MPQLCRVTDIFTRVFIYFSMSKNAEETNNMLDRWAKVFDKRFVNISQSQRGSIIVDWLRVLWMTSIYATHAQNIYKNTTIVTKISLYIFCASPLCFPWHPVWHIMHHKCYLHSKMYKVHVTALEPFSQQTWANLKNVTTCYMMIEYRLLDWQLTLPVIEYHPVKEGYPNSCMPRVAENNTKYHLIWM